MGKAALLAENPEPRTDVCSPKAFGGAAAVGPRWETLSLAWQLLLSCLMAWGNCIAYTSGPSWFERW